MSGSKEDWRGNKLRKKVTLSEVSRDSELMTKRETPKNTVQEEDSPMSNPV